MHTSSQWLKQNHSHSKEHTSRQILDQHHQRNFDCSLPLSKVPCRIAHKGMTFKSRDKFDYKCRLGTNRGIQQPFYYQLQIILPNPSEPTSHVTFVLSTPFYSTTDSEYLARFISVQLITVISCFLSFHVLRTIHHYIKSSQKSVTRFS